MDTDRATGNQSTGHDEIAQLLNEVPDENPLKPVVSTLTETVEEQADRIEELEATVEKQDEKRKHVAARAHERADEIEETNREQHKAIFRRLEAGLGDVTPTPEPGESGSATVQNGKSPLEQITNLPEHTAEDHLTENQQRARFVASDVPDYADSTPKGLVIDSRTVKKVLAVRDGDRPHTETVTRVMDFLDRFGKDEVETRMHKGRRIAVFDEQAVTRYGKSHLDPSQCGVIGQPGVV